MYRSYRLANFNGRHNRSKVKVWLYLASLEDRGIKQGVTINKIWKDTGVPISTLRTRIDVWWSWGRIKKHLLPSHLGDGSYVLYRISTFGRQYLNYVVPPDVIEECIEEIKQHQEEQRIQAEIIEKRRQELLKNRQTITREAATDEEGKHDMIRQAGGVAWLKTNNGNKTYHVVIPPFRMAKHLIITGELPENVMLCPGPKEAYQYIIKNS